MAGHGQAEKEASEVLRSFNILGAPQNAQVFISLNISFILIFYLKY